MMREVSLTISRRVQKKQRGGGSQRQRGGSQRQGGGGSLRQRGGGVSATMGGGGVSNKILLSFQLRANTNKTLSCLTVLTTIPITILTANHKPMSLHLVENRRVNKILIA